MPVYEANREIEIATSPASCFSLLTDYEQMPQWQTRVRRCRVLSRNREGLGREVEYEIDATLRTVRYRLRHLYRRPHWIGSEYLGGDFRCLEGEYALREKPHMTMVQFHLRIDPGLRIPAAIARVLNETVMGRSREDLKRRLEGFADGAQ
ncbi:MAG TPA: SRPBCC family protein [Solirubrobacteraceae bacterium]|nr:SRPBCC family protein [Solirubrobacteraceae bacterium]